MLYVKPHWRTTFHSVAKLAPGNATLVFATSPSRRLYTRFYSERIEPSSPKTANPECEK
jgi:hypothetical protein